MKSIPLVEIKVTFLRPEEGGRPHSAHDSPEYRPHLAVGEPNQRDAITDYRGDATEQYLGIQFTGDGGEIPSGVEYCAVVSLLYYPNDDYSSLAPGTTFTLREGNHIVGFGKVERWQ